METTAFDSWAIVEIFGHQKYAGRVTEQSIGGCNFVRVDVPETTHSKQFTKLFGQGAIFAISPVEESVARALAERYDQKPVYPYEISGDGQPRRIASNEDDEDFGDGVYCHEAEDAGEVFLDYLESNPNG